MEFDPRREVGRLAAAVQFLTRIPVPVAAAWEPDWLPRSAKYFPLVGALVGAVSAVTLLSASHVWVSPIPAILAVAVGLIFTGALHEDGLADMADALGGRTPEARLAIMKDSSIGSYGALALVACLALRVSALATVPFATAAALLVAAGASGRLACVVTLAMLPYAGDSTTAKVVHAADRPRGGELALAALFGLLPFALLPAEQAVAALLIGTGAAILLAWTALRLLGGYTGDVLGAIEVASEIGAFLGGAAFLPAAAWT